MKRTRQNVLDRGKILRRLRQNRALLTRYKVRTIGLFGSFAAGTAGPQSDVDFLVDFKEPKYDNFIGLIEALETLFGRKVEVLTPDGLNSIRVKPVAESIKRTLVYG